MLVQIYEDFWCNPADVLGIRVMANGINIAYIQRDQNAHYMIEVVSTDESVSDHECAKRIACWIAICVNDCVNYDDVVVVEGDKSC